MSDPPKKRGRPRSFDPVEALERAADTFLRYGYSGASLDDLTKAMGLAKPSLYAAFGDKRALFQKVIEDRAARVGQRYRAAVERGDTLEDALTELFTEAVELYVREGSPPGCVLLSASIAEAVSDETLATFTREFFEKTDRGIAKMIEKTGRREGAIPTAALGRLANGVIHDIALRARVGESKRSLRAYAREAAVALAHTAK